MAKCKRGHIIPPSRGYCVHFICHNEMIGGPKPEPLKQRTRAFAKSDGKRCPFCSGERTGQGKCFISACNRGPGGMTCGCHYQMAGMGNPGQEMWAMTRAKRLDYLAGGGARYIA